MKAKFVFDGNRIVVAIQLSHVITIGPNMRIVALDYKWTYTIIMSRRITHKEKKRLKENSTIRHA